MHFQRKHELYKYKKELSLMSLELATGLVRRYSGFTADVKISSQIPGFHSDAWKKYSQELNYDSNGRFEHRKNDFGALSTDKGYQGARDLLRVTRPIRAPVRNCTTASLLETYWEISSDRSIVEDYFGFVTSLCIVISR